MAEALSNVLQVRSLTTPTWLDTDTAGGDTVCYITPSNGFLTVQQPVLFSRVPRRWCTVGKVVLMQGTVKWFNDTKGFGFITPTDGSPDVFVHHSEIAGEGHKTLRDGDRVEFEMTQEEKGPKATNVRVLE